MSIVDLGPGAQQLANLIARVGDDELGKPTPCPSYTLGDLIEHVGGLALAFTAAANKDSGPGFKNEKADTLIAEARQTTDKKKRLELYAAVESIVNDELPILYLHHLTALQAGAMNLKGYQPAISGPFSTRGGGIRTAWLA
jgi:uncharacterized protein (TIGR03083 family)